MKVWAILLVSLIAAGPVGLLKRPDPPSDKSKGCSKETHRLVVEREDTFKLCLFPR